MSEVIRVLLVDDDPLVRSGLKLMLSGAEQIEVVGEVDDGRGVLPAVDKHHPDVVLMDIRMPELDGIAATDLLRRQPQPPQVLVLTTFDADELVVRALRAGAAGFLLKDTPPAEIVRSIELVHAGDPPPPPPPPPPPARAPPPRPPPRGAPRGGGDLSTPPRARGGAAGGGGPPGMPKSPPSSPEARPGTGPTSHAS